MRGLRWGATFVLGVSVFALTGCAGYKIVKLEEYEELRRAERLNTTQQGIISDLTHHNEQLQLEIKSLKGRLTDKEAYIASVEEELARLRTELTPSAGTETVPQLPGFDVGLEPEGLGIGVGSDVLFDTGKATLKP